MLSNRKLLCIIAQIPQRSDDTIMRFHVERGEVELVVTSERVELYAQEDEAVSREAAAKKGELMLKYIRAFSPLEGGEEE